jgi:hypothetical protein
MRIVTTRPQGQRATALTSLQRATIGRHNRLVTGCHSPFNSVVLQRPLPCEPLAEGCPVPAQNEATVCNRHSTDMIDL